MAAAMLHDLHRMLIIGNKTTAGQFDACNSLSTTATILRRSRLQHGQLCHQLEQQRDVRTQHSAHGVTYNGGTLTLGAGITFIDMLESVVRRIQQRINLSDGYNGAISGGDMVLVLPWDMVECLSDCYTCWHVCSSDITRVDSFEARNFQHSWRAACMGPALSQWAM